jgi:hypothetical protein
VAAVRAAGIAEGAPDASEISHEVRERFRAIVIRRKSGSEDETRRARTSGLSSPGAVAPFVPVIL